MVYSHNRVGLFQSLGKINIMLNFNILNKFLGKVHKVGQISHHFNHENLIGNYKKEQVLWNQYFYKLNKNLNFRKSHILRDILHIEKKFNWNKNFLDSHKREEIMLNYLYKLYRKIDFDTLNIFYHIQNILLNLRKILLYTHHKINYLYKIYNLVNILHILKLYMNQNIPQNNYNLVATCLLNHIKYTRNHLHILNNFLKNIINIH
jgi:hypothetical protein